MKRWKKSLAVLLSLVMLFGMTMTALAADAAAVIELEVSNSAPRVGEEFTVTAKITENTGFNAFDFQLTYDEEVVAFLGFESTYDEDYGENVLVSDFVTGSLVAFNDETGYIGLARTNDSTKTGTLFTAKFKAIAEGDAGIGYDGDKLNMTSGNGAALALTLDADALDSVTVSAALQAGYTVSLTPDTQEKAAGETAEVKVKVESGDQTSFNSIHTQLTYDPAYLTLSTASIAGYAITDADGTVTIVGYGEDKDLGEAVTLSFTVTNKPENGTDVTLTKANVDVSENADVQDAPEAAYGDKTATITVSGIDVTYPETEFNGSNAVKSGEDYTLTAKDPNYEYGLEATMGGETAVVIDNGDGTYTVKNVTDTLVITMTSKTGKSFAVQIEGAEEGQITGETTAVYMTDYTFTVNEIEGMNPSVAISIGGTPYTGVSAEDGVYTIPGKDITGEITITVTNTKSEYSVKFEGDAAGDAFADDMSVSHGEDFTFTVTKTEGYSYEVSATMGGKEVTVTADEDGTYTIEKVTGDLVITVNKTEEEETAVEVYEYVKADGLVVYLVTAANTSLPEGSALSYDGSVMYWSEEYEAYAYLVISDTVLTKEDAAAKVAEVTEANITSIAYAGDVNGTSVVDVNDAQLVYDIYNAKYSGFEELSMKKFLSADVNASKAVDVDDAAAVVNTILGNESAQ